MIATAPVESGPRAVMVPPATYLVTEGTGGPEQPAFRHAMAALYAVGHTLQLQLELEGQDFKLAPLGAQWWPAAGGFFEDLPGTGWRWKLMLQVPDLTDAYLIKLIKDSLVARRHLDDAADVRLEEIAEGECVEALHEGPYGSEYETLGCIHAFMVESHLKPAGPRHEIYLSILGSADPGRPLTLIRQPVC